MLRLFFVLVVLFGFQKGAMADSHVVKVLDGATAHCNADRKRALKNEKVVMVSLLHEKSSKNHLELDLQVSLVKCMGSSWVVDPRPSVESYQALDGTSVVVTFNQFKLLAVNKNYEILGEVALNQLHRQGRQVVSISIPQVNGSSQEVEILIQALKHVSADSGIEYSETFNFGSFRLRSH